MDGAGRARLGPCQRLVGAGRSIPHADGASAGARGVQAHEQAATLQQQAVHRSAHLHRALALRQRSAAKRRTLSEQVAPRQRHDCESRASMACVETAKRGHSIAALVAGAEYHAAVAATESYFAAELCSRSARCADECVIAHATMGGRRTSPFVRLHTRTVPSFEPVYSCVRRRDTYS